MTAEKESELEEYIDQSELVLGVLGYRVFEPRNDFMEDFDNIGNNECGKKFTSIPKLPDDSGGVGDFILQAMRNLEKAGYVFSDEQMEKLLSPLECNKKELFNLQNSGIAFFKEYDPSEDKPHYINGMQRYYTPKKVILKYGRYRVLLTKEWYDKYNHRELFKKWYETLE